MNHSTNPIPVLRRVALAEGVSLLVLIGIAMPLKYAFGLPLAVKVVGWIHGILFIVFCGVLLWTALRAKWSWSRAALIFIAGLVPFGPWLADRRLKSYEVEFGGRF